MEIPTTFWELTITANAYWTIGGLHISTQFKFVILQLLTIPKGCICFYPDFPSVQGTPWKMDIVFQGRAVSVFVFLFSGL